MALSKHNNGEILDCMQALSDITGLSFEKVCRTGISAWWSKVFEDLGITPTSIRHNCDKINTTKDGDGDYYFYYEGGIVIEPRKGIYYDLKVVDVVSLYPSMAILYNISFDTINCECCAADLNAKVPSEVLDKKEYWICKNKEGVFPKKLREFKAERIKQKQLGNNVKQLGLKILINGGYGLFGNPNFKYSDIRVAELITAYGRYTLSKMQEIAKSNGFDIVGGDTDSLFLLLQTSSNDDCDSSTANSDNISKFISKCKEQLNIDVEHSKTFAKAIIVKKKHYLGIDDKGNIIVKGMEGLKNDRPLWINDVFNQFVKDILTSNCSSTNNTTNNNNILVYLRRSTIELEEGKVESNRLKISVKLSKDPDQYATNTPQKKIGLLLNAKSGDVVQYYKSDSADSISLDPKEISVKKYKNMLWNAVKDILEILGYDINTMKNELLLFFNNDIS